MKWKIVPEDGIFLNVVYWLTTFYMIPIAIISFIPLALYIAAMLSFTALVFAMGLVMLPFVLSLIWLLADKKEK